MKKVVYTEQDRRIEVGSPLMRESLIDESVRRGTHSARFARHCREIRIINGLKRGLLARALEGEHVGTIVHA